MVAFNPSAPHRHVPYAGTVRNTDLHAVTTPDMLIITVESLSYRPPTSSPTFTVPTVLTSLLASQNDIINRFGCGTSSPAALRRFVKDALRPKLRQAKIPLALRQSHRRPSFYQPCPGDCLLTFRRDIMCGSMSRQQCNYASDMYYGMLGGDL